MNQAIIPANQTRPSGAADAPDIVFVLRRHIWLIVIGTIFCTGAAFGIWAYLYRYYPKYTAKVDFQVLPPQIPLGSAGAYCRRRRARRRSRGSFGGSRFTF